jgi:hypothetical protein
MIAVPARCRRPFVGRRRRGKLREIRNLIKPVEIFVPGDAIQESDVRTQLGGHGTAGGGG